MATSGSDKDKEAKLTPQQRRALKEIQRLRRKAQGLDTPPEEGAALPQEGQGGPEEFALETEPEQQEQREERKDDRQDEQQKKDTEYDRLKEQIEKERKEEFNRARNEAQKSAERGGKAEEGAGEGVGEGAQVARTGAQAARGAATGAGTAGGAAAGSAAGGAAAAGGAVAAEGVAAAGAAAAPVIGTILGVIGIILLVLLVIFIILLIVMISICNTTGPTAWAVRKVGSVTGYLPESVCQAISPGYQSSIGTPVQSASCTQAQLATYAQQFNTSLNSRNAPETIALMGCVATTIAAAPYNLPLASVGNVSTYDVSHPTCNVTRGQPLCEPSCSHAINSCHYGGSQNNPRGNLGALAIDYGLGLAANKSTAADAIIKSVNTCALSLSISIKRIECEAGASGSVSCNNPIADHVHVTLGSCDRL